MQEVYLYSTSLLYELHKGFYQEVGDYVVYPLYLECVGQPKSIFHSLGTCFFSSQGLCVDGVKVPTRSMRFKLDRKCRGRRGQSRENNHKRPRSAVASHWCRQLCDLSLVPLAVKMASLKRGGFM